MGRSIREFRDLKKRERLRRIGQERLAAGIKRHARKRKIVEGKG